MRAPHCFIIARVYITNRYPRKMFMDLNVMHCPSVLLRSCSSFSWRKSFMTICFPHTLCVMRMFICNIWVGITTTYGLQGMFVVEVTTNIKLCVQDVMCMFVGLHWANEWKSLLGFRTLSIYKRSQIILKVGLWDFVGCFEIVECG